MDDLTPLDSEAPDAPPPPDAQDDERRRIRLVSEAELSEPDWARGLARNSNMVPTKDAGNAALILCRTRAWEGVITRDVVADVVEFGECPPLPHLPTTLDTLPAPLPGELSEPHIDYVGLWLRRMWSQTWGHEIVRRAIVYAAEQNRIDPLAQYVDECEAKWDGQHRVGTWLADYLGGERTTANLRMGIMWLISAVARARKPGTKVDHALVLQGQQGSGKNRALEALFGDRYYLPELPDVRDKDAMHVLNGCWCACIDELSAIKAADVERVKSFLTRRIDRYRPPYKRDAVSRPRRTVFAATTNALEFLTDASGNRRYWPVTCVSPPDADGLALVRDQLWGEAAHMHTQGEQFWPTEEEKALLRVEQEKREVGDEWDWALAQYLARVEWTTVAHCLSELDIERRDWHPASQHRVSRVLQRAGWEPVRLAVDGRPRRHWQRGSRKEG